LLRGVNLGARNRIAMADLRALAEELGGEDVQTYVQSGNVVFRSGLAASTWEKKLAEGIKKALGLDVAVIVRSGSQLAKIVAGNPFKAAAADPLKVHVTFLVTSPDRKRVQQLTGQSFPPDELRVKGTEVYLHCPAGYGRSKLSNDLFERALGVTATTRNWRTVAALAELTGS
jgi:uncharacterized protein (DUF1697 family)